MDRSRRVPLPPQAFRQLWEIFERRRGTGMHRSRVNTRTWRSTVFAYDRFESGADSCRWKESWDLDRLPARTTGRAGIEAERDRIRAEVAWSTLRRHTMKASLHI